MVKIGLVLSGGGARGMAHIGVLKVLRENNIEINAIAGCSAGALAGACYAYDQNPEALEKIVLKIRNFNDILDFSFSKSGLVKGEKVASYIRDYLENASRGMPAEPAAGKMESLTLLSYLSFYFHDERKKTARKEYTFEDLKIPLYVNATDIMDGTEAVFSKGKLFPALMASMAYPGIFAPQKIDGKLYVDGGVTSPVPVHVLKDMDYLIVVDVSCSNVKITEDSGFRDILTKSLSLMQHNIVSDALERCKTPYILISPDVSGRNEFSFRNIPDAIKEGEKATKDLIEKIKKDIQGIEVKKS